jgi:hypothetical protein
MKKISALALIATMSASTAFAGGPIDVAPEPMIDVAPEATSSSNGGLLILLLLGLGLAAAASGSSGT